MATPPSASSTTIHRDAAAFFGFRPGLSFWYTQATKALPDAIQVADRWHLMENASRAFLDAVRKSMRNIRTVIGATSINPELLTCAERIKYEGYLHREETNAAILALAKDGLPIKQIVRQTGYSRGLVRQVVRGQHSDVFRMRQSSLDGYLPVLEDLWDSGDRNAAGLYRHLKARGFRGSLRVVGEWATRRRRAEQANAKNIQRVPSARIIARWMATGRNTLSKAEAVMVAAIEGGVPALVKAREMVAAFHVIIRRKGVANLGQWTDRSRDSLVASFVSGRATAMRRPRKAAPAVTPSRATE